MDGLSITAEVSLRSGLTPSDLERPALVTGGSWKVGYLGLLAGRDLLSESFRASVSSSEMAN